MDGSPCQFDEGSPLVQTIDNLPIAVGIVSKYKSCSLVEPSVYTRVSVYYSWLLKEAGEQPTIDPPTKETPGPTDEVTTDPIVTDPTTEPTAEPTTEPPVTEPPTEPTVEEVPL